MQKLSGKELEAIVADIFPVDAVIFLTPIDLPAAPVATGTNAVIGSHHNIPPFKENRETPSFCPQMSNGAEISAPQSLPR